MAESDIRKKMETPEGRQELAEIMVGKRPASSRKKIRRRCAVYGTSKYRKGFCDLYPYEKRLNSSSSVWHPRFEECQFHDGNGGWLLPAELDKTAQEIEDFCAECWICCLFPDRKELGWPDTKEFNNALASIFVDPEWWKRVCKPCVHLVEEVPVELTGPGCP